MTPSKARLPNGVRRGDDGTPRCFWCLSAPDYVAYHDEEWGIAVHDDQRLFEKLCLEGFQSGLSWLTILRKREAFRRAFRDFDFERVARFGEKHVGRLLDDASIVRHRGKIESTIHNAQMACELVDAEGSLDAYVWKFAPPPASRPRRLTKQALMGLSKTAESTALSKDLKRRGFTYVGPTTVYAFMQAMGLVNDHLEGCGFRTPPSPRRGRRS